MKKWILIFPCAALLCFSISRASVAAEPSWNFVVSGDSRNCGDVVMPAIAAGAMLHQAKFYWHLGDFRWLEKIDEDISESPKYQGKKMSIPEYRTMAWQDFIDNQLSYFKHLPVYLARGNHEAIGRSLAEYIEAFKPWLSAPAIRKDLAPDAPVQSYFHWEKSGVDFITLDNGSADQFDAAQLAWFKKRLKEDVKNPEIKSIVVGMHEALPDSISFGHSMSEARQSQVPITSGRLVYNELLSVRDRAHKNVYILASHSHFFMEGTFNTDYWKKHGGVLPGWIVGTAGAMRYPLPLDAAKATKAKTDVYGYLLAKVNPTDGTIQFDFQELKKTDVPSSVMSQYEKGLVDYCFEKNALGHQPN